MRCKYPLKAYWHIGNFTKNGKKQLEWSFPVGVNDPECYEEIEVPCGQCIACRLNYAREWAVRCVCEAREHEENYFVTLTYDPEHAKDILGNVGEDNILYFPTARMDDVTEFMKRLRADQEYRSSKNPNYPDNGIKFLACTEYGDQEQRPHAHIAIFGIHHPTFMDDGTQALMYWKRTKQGFILYKSRYLEKLWRNGNVILGEVSAWSAQYVAKYSVKNTDKMKEWCDMVHVEYPKLRMSRNPGIGKSYFEKHKIEFVKTGDGMYIDGDWFPIPDSWSVVGEVNLEEFSENVSLTLNTLDRAITRYEVRKLQTDKSREEELEEIRRRPPLDNNQIRKGY